MSVCEDLLMKVNLQVNGTAQECDIEPRTLLVGLLRENLGLTGTHVGCESSVCGACTVLLNGRAVKSCSVLAAQAQDQSIVTIEGLGPELDRIQNALWEEHGLQCGFCTPGVVMTLHDLLKHQPQAGVDEIRGALKGNLCRCTGYQNIVNAALKALQA
jgi:aerobic carbon-monoxide dehydrogenase small subunit